MTLPRIPVSRLHFTLDANALPIPHLETNIVQRGQTIAPFVRWYDKGREASDCFVTRIVDVDKMHKLKSETKPSKSQVDKFREAARDLETDDREEALDATLRKIAKSPTPKVCPECGHVFQGNGWDGIDAHWKSKHESVMPYAEAWPLIKVERYSSRN